MSWYTDAVCVCETDLKVCESDGLSIWECDSQTHSCESDVICNGTVNFDCQSGLRIFTSLFGLAKEKPLREEGIFYIEFQTLHSTDNLYLAFG